MEKKLLHSDEEYFAYCKENYIGSISRTYGSQCCDIENGVKCENGAILYEGTKCEEYLIFNSKPSHYPCVLAIYEDYEGNFKGIFIYPENFED